jgi:hypothetical protein
VASALLVVWDDYRNRGTPGGILKSGPNGNLAALPLSPERIDRNSLLNHANTWKKREYTASEEKTELFWGRSVLNVLRVSLETCPCISGIASPAFG